MLAIKRSLIRVSSCFPGSQFFDSSINLSKKCSIDSPFDCLMVRSMYLSKVRLRGRKNDDFLEFYSRQSINLEMRVSDAYNSSPFGPFGAQTEVKYRNSFAVNLYPWFITTHDSYFYLFLTPIPPVHFQLCLSR